MSGDGEHVPSYQCFREDPTGGTAKKQIKKNTFKAGMCMKTNESKTKCPKKFGHLSLNNTNFAEKNGLVTTICKFNFVFPGFFCA